MLEVQTQLTDKELTQAAKYRYKTTGNMDLTYNIFLAVGMFSIIVLALFFTAAFIMILNSTDDESAYTTVLIVFFAILPWTALVSTLIAARRYFIIYKRLSHKLLTPIRYVFSPDGLHIHYLQHNIKLHYPYPTIDSVKETKNEFFLIVELVNVYLLPKHTFQSDQQILELKNLLEINQIKMKN